MIKSRIEQQILEKIKDLLESLEYGSLHITVHDSQITQIDKLEKHRVQSLSKTKAGRRNIV